MRNRYAVRHRPGFALNLFNFILTTVGTTALATASIIAAYQKFVVEPRTPSELTRLQHENSELQSANVRLGREISASAQTRVVRERNLFEAAEAIEVNKTALPAAVKVPYAVRYRGLT